ncbi:hypothetical protein GM547_13555, partial [Streptococcus pneumoniae]|uniref:hypothetical protein n=1 Tax=Streptococcus pneumoniae TaxID=1313 RepID=UPI0012D7F802
MNDTTKFDRSSLTTLHNHGKTGCGLRSASPKGDALVAQGFATRDGFRYTITEAGEARLRDYSDVTTEQAREI